MKIKNNKKIFFPLLSVFLAVGIFLLAQPAQANWPAEVIGGLLGLIIGGLGVILSLVMKALVMVAQYSEFIDAPAVSNGWKIVRDLCNMFFVLILLIIAFATILHQEKYDYKKWLPKLIMMAILINFSKTICGILIDFAQVIMLTFVNAFKGMAAGNLVSNLGLTEIMTLAKDGGSEVGFFEIVTAYLLGLIYVIIALVVIVTMLAMLVMRIVMMWVYIVLSPAAYLLAAFPDGKTYSEKWWKQFTENLIVGPVLAFFIWLSFASLQSPDFDQFSNKDGLAGGAGETQAGADVGVDTGSQTPGNTSYAATKASTPNAFIKFVIAIGMLIGGLKIAQEVGGAASDIAGKGFSKIKNGASAISNSANKFAKDRAKKAAKWSGRGALLVGSSMAKGAGKTVNKLARDEDGNLRKGMKIAGRVGDSLTGAGGIGLAWRADMIETKNKATVKKRQDFMEKIGMGEKSMDKTNEFLKTDTGKELSLAASGAAAGTVLGGPVGTIAGFIGGGAVSYVSGKLKNRFKNKEEDSKNELSAHQLSYDANKSIADGEQSDADNLRAQARTASAAGNNALAGSLNSQADHHQGLADQHREFASEDKKNIDSSRSKMNSNKAIKEFFTSAQAFTSETTQKAAKKGSEDVVTARDRVSVLSKDKDAMKGKGGFDGSSFYSTSGQTSAQKKLFTQLTDKESATGKGAIKNLEDWVSTLDVNNKDEMARLASFAKGTAAFAKGGGDVGGMSTLISMMDAKNAINPKGKVDSVANLKEKVIANRKTGAAGEQGSGSFDVNTFANNTSGEGGKNLIGVDFNKLAGAGLDVKAEASFASGSAMAPIVEALKKQISEERAKLNELGRTDGISDSDFTKKHNDLDKAEARLNDPKQVQDLQLINTASANYGRQERMTSKYHEEIHKGGVEDEDLTERTAQSLMANKLYGRNASTKGRHASEVGAFAQNLKNQGMSNDDIMKEVDKEIQSRLQSEGKNRAERVVKIMNGDKETVTEAVEEGTIEAPELNTDKLQESLDVLSEKFEKTASSFKNISGGAGGDKKGLGNVAFALNNIKKTISAGNAASLKKMGALSGGKAPSTIIEASALNDAAGSSKE